MSRWLAPLCCIVAVGVSAPAAAGPSTPPPPPDRNSAPPPAASPEADTTSPGPAPKNPSDAGTKRTAPPPPGGGTAETAKPSGPASVKTIPDDPVDLSHTWTYSGRRSAPAPRVVRRSDPVYAAPNPVGFYSGVSLGGNQVPPFPAERFDAKPALLTWTGFERGEGGSQVYFQLSAPVRFEVDQKGTTVKVRIHNTKVNVRNNARRLDLRYFETPAQQVKVRRRGKDLVVTITLKHQATPTVELVDGGEGYKMLVVRFGSTQPTRSDTTAPKS